MTLIGRPTLPANTYKELAVWIDQNKGKINLGNAGLGAASHLCGLLYQNAIHYHHSPEVAFNNVPPEDFKLIMSVYAANQMSPLFTENPRLLNFDMTLFKHCGIIATPQQFVERFEPQFNDIMLEVIKVSDMMFGASASNKVAA